jgi:ribosomal protein S18 acetylase RimI-like enzyme
MSDVAVQVAGAERVADLRSLYLALLEHDRVHSPVPMNEPGERAWLARRATYLQAFSEDRAVLLVAERDRALVGYALVLVHAANDDTFALAPAFAELYSLSVAPAARGVGIGSRLMDAVDEVIAARSLRALTVAVTVGNEHALRFYRRRGLVPTELQLYRLSTSHD